MINSNTAEDIDSRVAEAKRLAREAGVQSFAVLETNIKMGLKQKIRCEIQVHNERDQMLKAQDSLLNWYINVRHYI